MQEGKIIYQGKTKNGQDLIIRYPLLEDVEQLTSYINTLSVEQTFIRFQGEQQTIEQEEMWLKKFWRKLIHIPELVYMLL